MQPLLFLAHVASQLSCSYFPYDCMQEVEAIEDPLSPAAWIEWVEKLYQGSDPTRRRFARCFSTAESRRVVALTAATQVQICADHDISITAVCEPAYPPLLRHIADPPLCLFSKGNLGVLQRPHIAVIGSRRCSQQAAYHAYRLGYKAAQCGISIVSGGAYGCDIAAHQGVLAAGGVPLSAVAVFAGGFPLIGPQGNLRYFREIESMGGILLTERLWGTFPTKRDFPVRNRLISGLAPVTVVVQAGLRSGTMVTAKMALDQGRELIVFSYESGDPWAEGSQSLIEEGAESVDAAETLLLLLHQREVWGSVPKGAGDAALA